MNDSTKDTIHEVAKNIELLILDVDGVLTNGKVYHLSSGDEMLAFHIHDGFGLKRLQASGVKIAIISGRNIQAARIRLTNLGIEHIYLGEKDKLHCYQTLQKQLNIQPENIAYIGDDLPDLPVMRMIGLPIAVKNAVDDIKKIALWKTKLAGGKGAVREACDLIYAAKNA